ncbi:MAG: chromosome segregation SMC family protein [Bacilli bacterium]
MYLKEIEISGFKSFADKINLNLDNEITCIVGPNGSGKSNIVDAIRFVLGEQSVKSLRGDALMSDVIFSGSKNRNPMHAASVTLTFDNADNYLKIPYQTVSVKRRLYKTGDNEYFLNGEKCRLKDIIDLFLDSGMGRDSFNIISQGDISKLLSNSAYDRRLVIEEAAGILKYKKRREEAFRKLDKTNLNLDRANDIIQEVETRVNPLKEQSEKATTYLEIKKKLENIEVGVLVTEITNLNQEYIETKDKIKSLNTSIISLNKKVNDPEIDELKIEVLNLEKKLQKINQELLSLSSLKEEINSQRLLLKERIKYNTNDLKNQETINYLTEKKLKLEKDLNLVSTDLDNLKVKKEELTNDLENLVKKLKEIQEKNNYLQKEIVNKTNDYDRLINKIDILKSNLTENMYLNNNVKRILDNKRLNGIHDALINLISTSNTYQTCLDVVSLANKNFLIVDSSESARNAIRYLKENNLGRVTFLPLDTIKAKYVDYDTQNKLTDIKGYLGILTDFLEYKDEYKDIILNQFGNILVVDTLENANYISKVIQNKYRIVTLDGEIIHVGGSITGGSLNNKNLINTKNELTDLELKSNLEKNTLTTLNKEKEELENNIIIIDNNMQKIRTDLLLKSEELKNFEEKKEEKEKELKDLILELNSYDISCFNQELEKLNKNYYDKSLEYDLKVKEKDKILEEKDNLQSIVLEKEGFIKVNNQALKEQEKELQRLEILVNKLDTKLDNDLNYLNQDYNLTYERARDEYSLDLEMEEAKNLVIDYKNKLKNIGNVNLDSIEEYKNVLERYNFLTGERDDLLKAKDMLYSLIDEMDEVMKNDFYETFQELQIEFKKVFRSLFKGGDASLTLTDPDNLMETGVDIVASPPGKKLKTITLLSGGEKTLTAISLLFAILNIRQVPFCVFDEVEAALDEANVDNFGSYLHSYKDKTQFLLITHKKRTMEYAKTLYGITMQESGVSKLVSVKLEDKDKL